MAFRRTHGFTTGKCRSCGSPLSYFARACPACEAANQPNPVTAAAALLAVAVFAAALGSGFLLFGRNAQAPGTAGPGGVADSAAAPGGSSDYGWIVKAMAECEEEAKQSPQRLHFLIVPVIATGNSLPGWSPAPIGAIGPFARLLKHTDTLLGLRNGVFVLYPKPITFVISDPATEMLYKWKPAVGVARLKTRDNDFSKLKLGFEIPDIGVETQWGPTVPINQGTCYWINPLIETASR
jgi:hypothetical protein